MRPALILTVSGKNERGFSLIELLISLAIVGLIMATLAVVFERSSRLYTTQNVSAALQEEVRATLEIMVREMRMAGFDPGNTKKFKIEKAESSHLRFALDRNANQEFEHNGFPDCEQISFRWSMGQQKVMIICNEDTVSADIQSLIGGEDSNTKVTALKFDYVDKKNKNPNQNEKEITGAVITLTAQAPAGRAGLITRTYSTRVAFRNLGG